ncbi:MAG: hypothetical protein GY862_37610, partial [Gammaproteobacteria bacterium]|nr:hypothetical protein [Gammaproteobacteria bacterium]
TTETGKSLSLIGGGVEISEGAVVAPSGRLNLASVASSGEVVPAAAGLEIKGAAALGDLSVIEGSALITQEGGGIYIRAEQFVLDDSSIIAGSGAEGSVIDIRVKRLDTIGDAWTDEDDEADEIGDIDSYSVWILSTTQNEKQGGNLIIKAGGTVNFSDTLVMANSGMGDLQENEEDNISIMPAQENRPPFSIIPAQENRQPFSIMPAQENRHPLGDAGDIFISAAQLNLSDTLISSDTYGAGQGGDIALEINGKITLVNDTLIFVNAYEKSGRQAGNAGTILLKGEMLDVINSTITSATAGAGHGGSVTLEIKGPVFLDEAVILVSSTLVEFVDAATGARSIIPPTGNSGQVLIKADKITFRNSGIISATYASGKGGGVEIHARNAVVFTDPEGEPADELYGIFADSLSADAGGGDAGEIRIETPRLLLADGAVISTSTHGGGEANDIHISTNKFDLEQARITSTSTGNGDAGDIAISARDTLTIRKNGAISTQTLEAQGGNITLDVGRLAYLLHGGIATNVYGGMGSGGNIKLAAPEFTVLNSSAVIAGAAGGDGGNIRIVSEQFMPSADSLIDASSELGIDGNIETVPPDTNIGAKLLVLPDDYLDADKHLATPCARIAENISTFNLIDSRGVPASHDDWLRGGPLLE